MPGAQGLLSVTQVPLKSKSLTHKNKARIHSRLKNKCIAVTIKPHIGFQLCRFLDPLAYDAFSTPLLIYPMLETACHHFAEHAIVIHKITFLHSISTNNHV